MEITNEIKAKIMAPYAGVSLIQTKGGSGWTLNYSNLDEIIEGLYKNSYIQVKPLSKITDEEMDIVLKLQGYNSEYKEGKLRIFHFSSNSGCLDACVCFIGKEHDSYECINSSACNYLQSRGYALPYMEYSVEDLVTAGIYKLIED